MGLGIQDALFLLENNGIRVKVYGSGTVSHQSINPGEHFLKGQTIELQLT